MKACFNFLVAEIFSLCVPATPCSITSKSRLTPVKGEEIQHLTKDTSEKTPPSVAPAKLAPAPKPACEPESQELVPLVPLSGLGDDSGEGLEATFSGLYVGGPEGKEKEKEKEAVDMGVEEVDPRDGHEPSDEVPFDDKPAESAPSYSYHPAVPSPTATTLPATHPATSSPKTTPPMAEGLGFTGMPYSTYGVTPAVSAPPMATVVNKPVASSSTYTGFPESIPRRYDDDYHKPAAAVYMNGIPGYVAPEPGFTMSASGFTSLSLVVEGVGDQEDSQTSPRRGRRYEKLFEEPLQT